jgi:2-polyprenyl-3-methyl-5-hydroxy-6-metoxy-1,4-benzoquinol methylase
MKRPDLRARATGLERMDDLAIGGAELEGALQELRAINRLLGAAWPTLVAVRRLWREAGRPKRLSLLDVGAASGDPNRLLLRWADRAGLDLQITLLELNPETCAHARAFWADEPRVRIEQGDLFALPPNRADLVTAAMLLHHLPTPDLGPALRRLRRAARIGVVVNDLHRHPLAWHVIRWATALLSQNPMIRHDAPLSVARGFVAADLRALQAEADLGALRFYWAPLFRWLLILPGTGSESDDGWTKGPG